MQLSKVLEAFLIGSSVSLISATFAFAGTGVITTEDTNVYAILDEENAIIGKLGIDKEVTIIGEEEDWLKITCDEFANVYIPKQSVSVNKAIAVVTNDSVNVRQQPSMSSTVLGQTDSDTNITLTAKVGDWYELDYNGEQAYIYGDYVNGNFLSELPLEEVAVKTENSDLGHQIVAYAEQFLGTPYVYGASNLRSGTDCSGFTSSVMRNFGINLSRSSREQVNNGIRISKNELSAGDLVFFNNGGGGISHVGLYIGNGKFIHSSSARTGGVIISSLNESYYANTYVAATRVI